MIFCEKPILKSKAVEIKEGPKEWGDKGEPSLKGKGQRGEAGHGEGEKGEAGKGKGDKGKLAREREIRASASGMGKGGKKGSETGEQTGLPPESPESEQQQINSTRIFSWWRKR